MGNEFNKSGLNISIVLSIIVMVLLIINKFRYEAYGDFVYHIISYIVILSLFIFVKLKFQDNSSFLASPVYGGFLVGFIVFAVLHIIAEIVGFSIDLYNSAWGLISYLFPFSLIPFLLIGVFFGFIYSVFKK